MAFINLYARSRPRVTAAAPGHAMHAMQSSILWLLAITWSLSASGATVLNETFDGRAYTTSVPFFSDGVSDYFGIYDGNGDGGAEFGADPLPARVPIYTGLDDNYLAAQDLDGEGGPAEVSVTWAGIDISALTLLTLSVDLAEGLAADGNQDIDSGEVVRLEASIDAGGFNTIAEFRSDRSTNGLFRLDTDLDGVGDGTALGPAARRFVWDIPGTGSALDLLLTVSVNAGDEDLAIDNLQLTGTVVPLPAAGWLMLGALGLLGARARRSRAEATARTGP